ncbi:hypothetical protein PRZ48_000884 [Zasmidium cellare]|uniref:Cell wall mannoprotein PIR1-like C-terminal domain-containing protein n=1 Tax=Zasmidium cellare TaxID=395010 RepID=A0ABR0F1G0_ZASCE|nr:hypothetical protein PRZ48_000884 [Zasmidium cellare]
MRYSLAAVALATLASATPVAQAPAQAAASSCSPSYSGTFNIQAVNVTTSSKRSLAKRQSQALTLTLADGILKDNKDRIGYIAANNQFQFDNPVQTGTIYDKGWAVCSNGTLVLGPTAVFQQCLSGGFFNLYDENSAAQCSPVYLQVINGGAVGAATASEEADGQPTASGVQSQQADGQVTGSPVSQIGDGQPQAPTGNPITQISDGQIQGPTGSPIQQISDGQPQAPTGSPVQQISDGQIQATTGSPITQIGDGQPQVPTGAPITQISDGQIQAPTGSPITQISDGQVQVPTGSPVQQISDGQIQKPTGNNGTIAAPSASVQPYTGAAASSVVRSELFGLAAGVLAVALL